MNSLHFKWLLNVFHELFDKRYQLCEQLIVYFRSIYNFEWYSMHFLPIWASGRRRDSKISRAHRSGVDFATFTVQRTYTVSRVTVNQRYWRDAPRHSSTLCLGRAHSPPQSPSWLLLLDLSAPFGAFGKKIWQVCNLGHKNTPLLDL